MLPSEALAYVIVDFNFQWLELLHQYWRLSGETEFVRRMWPTVTRMLDRFIAGCRARRPAADPTRTQVVPRLVDHVQARAERHL